MLVVQKYGGATLASPEKILQVARRISDLKKSGTNVVAVVSAMGQTTNELIQLAHQVSKNPSLRELDMLLSVGERTSMALVTMALNDLQCPAISFTGSQAGILTDDAHISANIIDVKAFRVSEALKNNKVVILAGFQGVSPTTKEITTLGRGGTDTTAVAMAAHLGADHCEILKDVDGIYTTDPKIAGNARPIHQLSYDQLFEMTLWGAKVLNYKSVIMAKDKNLKLYVGAAQDGLDPINNKSQSPLNTHDTCGKLGTWISSINSYTKNQPLAVSTYSQVLDIRCSNTTTFEQLKNHFKESQIAEPQLLKSGKTENSMTRFLISGPGEILHSIENYIKHQSTYKIHDNMLCSVSLTFSAHTDNEIQKQIEQKFKESDITAKDTIFTNLNLNYILQQEEKNKAIQILHSFI